MQLIYHSMPKKCFADDIYQNEFLARFMTMSNANDQKHVIDCVETNPTEFNQRDSVVFTNFINKISPQLVSIGQRNKINSQNIDDRTELDEKLRTTHDSKFKHDFAQIDQMYQVTKLT